jgi:drug/metabolite transporter (DMT)-like permease
MECHGLFVWEEIALTNQTRADLMLLVVTIFWGASYMLTKLALDVLEPFNLAALRFLIAFAVSALVFRKNIMKSDIKTIKYSLILAVILVGMFISMAFGLKYTTTSNAGFLISLAVIIIPILSYAFLKQKIEKGVLIGVCIAPVGIALLTLNTQLRVSGGDLLCILCAFLSAVHVVAMGVFTRKADSIALGILQLGFAGVFSILFSLFTETVKLPNTTVSWGATLALSILCTAFGYIVQATAQKYTSASHTGLILSLEPVFSAILGFAFLGEVLPLRGYIGAAILLLSVLIAETGFKKKDAKETEINI